MKIKKIVLKNNPIFNDIDLDFCDKQGRPLDTIILAGENGCGKTTILNMIYYFSYLELDDLAENEKREFFIEINENYFKSLIKKNELNYSDLGSDFIVTLSKLAGEKTSLSYISKNDGEIKPFENIYSLLGLPNNYITIPLTTLFKTIYSTSDDNYTPKTTKTVTSKDIDSPYNSSIKSNNSDLATEIQQLFIDIQNYDAIELSNWVINNPNAVPPADVLNKRINRFSSAFSTMFDNLSYHTIETKNNVKKVLFNNNGAIIPLSNLSSGEKQIIFRGAFFLRDKETIEDSIILIDEPENSLHPNWQSKILDFYKDLNRDINFRQLSQIFVSTHSPFIIHGHSRIDDKVIVLKKENGNIIQADNVFASIGIDSLINEAFNTRWIESMPPKPIIVTEGCTDWKHMKAAYNHLMKTQKFKNKFGECHFSFLEYESGKNSNLKLEMGVSELVSMCKQMAKIKQSQKIIFIADNDAHKQTIDLSNESNLYKDWGNNVYSFIIPVPRSRIETPNICIEHYYSDEDIKREFNELPGKRLFMGNEFNSNGISIDKSLMCTQRNSCGNDKINIIDGNSNSSVFLINDDNQENIALSKNYFANKILEDVNNDYNVDFNNFIELFDIIKNIIDAN